MTEFSNIVFENGVTRPWWPSWQHDLRLHISYSVQSITRKFFGNDRGIYIPNRISFIWIRAYRLCFVFYIMHSDISKCRIRIGHFEFLKSHFQNEAIEVQNVFRENLFYFYSRRIKNHLPIDGFAPSLALKRRLWVTRKWFIVRDVNFIWFSIRTGKLERICTRFQRAGWKCRIWRKRKWIWYRKYSTVCCAQ